jgi:hypothetical protein
MSATLAAIALSLCHNTALAYSDVQLHPKLPVFALQFRFISESRATRGDDSRVHDRPRAQQQPPFSQSPVIELNIAWVSLCCPQQVAKARILLSLSTASSPSSIRAKRHIDSLS